jgi:hypothetical protein
VEEAESEGIKPAMRNALEYLRIMMLGNAKKKQKHRVGNSGSPDRPRTPMNYSD